jgi:hypothetical protein
MNRHAVTRRLKQLSETAGIRMPRMHPHMLRHLRHDHAGRGGQPPGCADRRPARRPKTTMRYDRARKNLDRHPNYILAAYMASGT